MAAAKKEGGLSHSARYLRKRRPVYVRRRSFMKRGVLYERGGRPFYERRHSSRNEARVLRKEGCVQ